MKMLSLLPFLVLAACSTSKRAPASPVSQIEMPSGALTLEQALNQGPEKTLPFLKSHLSVQSFPSINTPDPTTDLPSGVRMERGNVSAESKKNRNLLLSHIRRVRPWTVERKTKRAREILAGFQCSHMYEAQGLGLSLERDFPNTDAQDLSEQLHIKVVGCNDETKQESLFRLTVFSIQKGECPKALEFLKQFPPTNERGVNDRIAYLHGFCAPPENIASRNPWGGYGVRLGDLKLNEVEKPVWFLSANSGSEDWDRLLMSLIELSEKGEKRKIQFLATHLNYERLRELPYPFQASVMTVLSFGEADLSVFQTLHKFLADHPALVTKEVAGLLFPVRYWNDIVENSTGADPILIKSLIRQESAFNPAAKSRARAYGLMQLIYPTAKLYGIRKPAQLIDPKNNIRVGSKFLSQLIEKFGSVELALAAYNAGPDVVREWQKRYPTNNIDLFVEMIPYSETREYVRLIERNYRIYKTVLTSQATPVIAATAFSTAASSVAPMDDKPRLADIQGLMP